MKNITKALLLTIVGFNFALAADNVHALTVDQMKVCKATAFEYKDSSLTAHYKARLSLRGVHGNKQNVYRKIAKGLSYQQSVNILTSCGLDKRAHDRNYSNPIQGSLND